MKKQNYKDAMHIIDYIENAQVHKERILKVLEEFKDRSDISASVQIHGLGHAEEFIIPKDDIAILLEHVMLSRVDDLIRSYGKSLNVLLGYEAHMEETDLADETIEKYVDMSKVHEDDSIYVRELKDAIATLLSTLGVCEKDEDEYKWVI